MQVEVKRSKQETLALLAATKTENLAAKAIGFCYQEWCK
jgi:hypothetical protein